MIETNVIGCYLVSRADLLPDAPASDDPYEIVFQPEYKNRLYVVMEAKTQIHDQVYTFYIYTFHKNVFLNPDGSFFKDSLLAVNHGGSNPYGEFDGSYQYKFQIKFDDCYVCGFKTLEELVEIMKWDDEGGTYIIESSML